MVLSSSVRRIEREDLLGLGIRRGSISPLLALAVIAMRKFFHSGMGRKAYCVERFHRAVCLLKVLIQASNSLGKIQNYVGLRTQATRRQSPEPWLVIQHGKLTNQIRPKKWSTCFRFSPPPSCFQHFRFFMVILPRLIVVPAALEKGVTTVVKSV
jgi:hypothetical protein